MNLTVCFEYTKTHDEFYQEGLGNKNVNVLIDFIVIRNIIIDISYPPYS